MKIYQEIPNFRTCVSTILSLWHFEVALTQARHGRFGPFYDIAHFKYNTLLKDMFLSSPALNYNEFFHIYKDFETVSLK